MREPLYFDGAPDRFSRTKALFAETSRLQVRYPATAATQPRPWRKPSRQQGDPVSRTEMLKGMRAWTPMRLLRWIAYETQHA